MLHHKEASELNIVIKNGDEIISNHDGILNNHEILTKDFEIYILNLIKMYPVNRKIELVIEVKEHNSYSNINKLQQIIKRHFSYKYKEAKFFSKVQFKEWIINMFIGILFLVLCLLLVQIMDKFSYINIFDILKESLLIIGWVALWEPVTFILFDWRKIKKEELYYKKLYNMPIKVINK